MDLVRLAWKHDRIPWADHCRVRLEKQQWLFRDRLTELRGVVGIVSTYADDLAARDDRSEQAYVCQGQALTGELDRPVERIADHHRHRLAASCTFHHAVSGLPALCGEPRNSHLPNPSVPCPRAVGGDQRTVG